MKLSTLTRTARRVARKGRAAFRRVLPFPRPQIFIPLPGQFQPYSHTLPDRYPWLFSFAAEHLGGTRDLRILSFGCSRGDEIFSLRRYFPTAALKGIDVDPKNIEHCLTRVRAAGRTDLEFATAATTEAEQTESYDAIFCLAVLAVGDLTTQRLERCDPVLHFADFERVVTDFTRCLKPGGLLLLHTTNFRFCDTSVAGLYDTMLEATPEQMASDVLFDRDNRLMRGARYYSVAFRKR